MTRSRKGDAASEVDREDAIDHVGRPFVVRDEFSEPGIEERTVDRSERRPGPLRQRVPGVEAGGIVDNRLDRFGLLGDLLQLLFVAAGDEDCPPSAASRPAAARPMPLLPPVIRDHYPSKRPG